MKSSPDLGNVSQEAYFLITKATECFVQYMAQEAHKSTEEGNTLQYKQLGMFYTIFIISFHMFYTWHSAPTSRAKTV